MPKDTLATRFRLGAGKRAHLARRDPADASAFPDRRAAEEQSKADGKVINEWQDKLFAEGKRALLVVLQGVDTAGKDGTIRHVFNETGPIGVTVTPFRRPCEEDLAHDFLWRVHIACPRRGYRRHLQPLALRGRAGGARAQARAARRHRRPLRPDQRLRAYADRERHHHPQVHAAHLQEGAGRAPARSPGRTEQPLEVRPRATSRTASCGTSIRRPTRSCCRSVPPRTPHGM